MSATCGPWHLPRGTMGLSKHGGTVFLHPPPRNQNLARVQNGGGGGDVLSEPHSPRGPEAAHAIANSCATGGHSAPTAVGLWVMPLCL